MFSQNLVTNFFRKLDYLLAGATPASLQLRSARRCVRACGQMQEDLARERRKLTLWGAPGATLRHFAINAGASAARGAAVAAAHPATLFLALPLLALYLSLKYTGAPPLCSLLTPLGDLAPPLA